MSFDLYLDECCPLLLGDQLQSSPHVVRSVQHAQDAGQRGKSDAEQIRYASQNGLILVTFNIDDFIWLHRWWKTLHSWEILHSPHPEILAAPMSRAEEFSAAIVSFLSQNPAPVFENNLYIYKQGNWTHHHS